MAKVNCGWKKRDTKKRIIHTDVALFCKKKEEEKYLFLCDFINLKKTLEGFTRK